MGVNWGMGMYLNSHLYTKIPFIFRTLIDKVAFTPISSEKIINKREK